MSAYKGGGGGGVIFLTNTLAILAVGTNYVQISPSSCSYFCTLSGKTEQIHTYIKALLTSCCFFMKPCVKNIPPSFPLFNQENATEEILVQ